MNRKEGRCRTCMTTHKNLTHMKYNLDKENTMQIHKFLANLVAPIGLKILLGDGLPEEICDACLNTLQIAYEFQQAVIETDKCLRESMYESLKSAELFEIVEIKSEPPDSSAHLSIQSSHFETDQTASAYHVEIKLESTDFGDTLAWKAPEGNAINESIPTEVQKIKEEFYSCSAPDENFVEDNFIVENIPLEADDSDQPALASKNQSADNLYKYKCVQCSTLFMLEMDLIDHMKRKHQKENTVKPISYSRKFRDKVFEQKAKLNEHLTSHTSDKKKTCPKCGKKILNLHQHMLRHSDERTYQCKLCPKKFFCCSDVQHHQYVHTKERRFMCAICGASFIQSCTLRKHERIHKGERPHSCEKCGMSFIRYASLKRHIRTHTGERPYKCQYCENTYSASGDLTKHLRSHVGKNTYFCDECPQSFKYKKDLREHQSHHYIESQKNQNTNELDVHDTLKYTIIGGT